MRKNMLPKTSPPLEKLMLPTVIVTRGKFCGSCSNRSGNSCFAQDKAETLILDNAYELYNRTKHCLDNAVKYGPKET
jgi:hypothetical protein